jgi:hypothetical protein
MNDQLHGDEHIKMIEPMTKYQLFAVNHYLQEFDNDMSFEEVLHALLEDMNDAIPYDIYEASLTLDEIADSIVQMAEDLEERFK